MFSKVSNEMVSTHGYSLNQINVWSTKTNWDEGAVDKIATLTGHTYRVLYLAGSPDGCSVLTGAGDETLRFWNVFDRGDINQRECLSFTADLR
jgi:cell division cycle 20-like protein 1 (cofactor of APC complex)